jgi:hypothetical protein
VTPFDKWFESTVVPTMPRDMPADARKLVREPFMACWNAALGATKQRLLTCCCGHQMIEQHIEFGRCTEPGCDCMNACDCWQIVLEHAEADLESALTNHVFAKLLVFDTKPSVGKKS